MGEPSIPIAARPALISSMNGIGPQRCDPARSADDPHPRDRVARPPFLRSNKPLIAGPAIHEPGGGRRMTSTTPDA
jgi:hypothetical protein